MQLPVTRAEIDLGAIAHNVTAIKGLLDRRTRLMAVVKADAYGHGASQVARTALAHGADYLSVARLNEALQLRQDGLMTPILLFGYAGADDVEMLIENDITASLGSLESALVMNQAAERLGRRLKVHVKVDTGMGRLGFQARELGCGEDASCAILKLARLKHLEIEGLYTHFACADSCDKASTLSQFERFAGLIQTLEAQGLAIELKHAANSAAVMELPQTHLDMVRPGIVLYGLYPSDEVDRSRLDLRPAMTLKSTVIQVKEVPAGFAISYGSTYVTDKPAVIATVPVGYADGYSRLLSSKGQMLVHGKRAPIVGRVCMDLTMLDVSGIDGVKAGDEVVVFGRSGGADLSADEVAALIGTINYEVITVVNARVPRIYRQRIWP